jgi:integrase
MPDERSKAQPRRVWVKDGIYRRPGAPKGRNYEIGYTDSDGRRRWRMIAGGLRDAEAAREEVRTRMRRGERIAPTRATVAEYAQAWLATQGHLRPRTLEKYEGAMRVHILPAIGRVRLSDVHEEHVVFLIDRMRRQGYAPWTIRGVVTPLGRLLGHAARRGVIASNPVLRLERGERPAPGRREQRVLAPDEIERLLASAHPRFRTLLATAAFTGARLGELLGLVWVNVDFEAGFVRVRKQLDRTGNRVDPKTPQALRDVVLMPALARLLREHRLASPFSSDSDCVFASARGTPLYFRNVERRGLDAAAAAAGLNDGDRPKLRLHDLRHTFASMLISSGADVVTVSRQLGHAAPDITLRVYAHLFDQARHAERTRGLLESEFGALLHAAGKGAVEGR